MKKNIYIILLLLLAASCSEQEIITYGDGHNIYFDKFYMDALSPGKEKADSTSLTFFFTPDNIKEQYAELVVNMTGKLLEKDLPFQLRVVPEMTTATPDEYSLDAQYFFRAGKVKPTDVVMNDTIRIKMLCSERLASLENGVRLVLEFVPNNEVGAGQYERQRAVIFLTSVPVRPEWWTREVEEYLLGPYSHKKYKLFINHIDTEVTLDERMIKNRPDEAIKLARKFKIWLNQQNPAIIDENGYPMYVNV